MSNIQDILDSFLVLSNRTQNVFPKLTDVITRVYILLKQVSVQAPNEDVEKLVKQDANDLFEYLMDLAEISDSTRKLLVELVELQRDELQEVLEEKKKAIGK